MSHREQLAFVELCANANAELLVGAKVIEIGSYDVNGSVRGIFKEAAEYVGVDLVHGPGVDLVGFGHRVDHPSGAYDVAVSGECFEHDPHWPETFENMVRLTRPGGLVIVTCASRGRVEHGTSRSGKHYSPGTQNAGIDYYRNVHLEDLQELPLDYWFSCHEAWYLETSFDLFFVGVRAGRDGGVIPDDQAVRDLSALISRPLWLMRMPLRLAARRVRDRDRYQLLALPYWKVTTSAGDVAVALLERLGLRPRL